MQGERKICVGEKQKIISENEYGDDDDGGENCFDNKQQLKMTLLILSRQVLMIFDTQFAKIIPLEKYLNFCTVKLDGFMQ